MEIDSDISLEEYLFILLECANTIKSCAKDPVRVEKEINFVIENLHELLEARWEVNEKDEVD